MNNNLDLLSDKTLYKLISHKVIDLFIRVGLIGFLVVLCYQIFRPFIGLILWSIILAVAMYPLHVLIARKMGGRDGRAATALVLAILLSVLIPTTLLAFSFADSTTGLVKQVQSGTLQVPAPNQAVAGWPVVGENLYALWSAAHTDLGSVVAKYEPKIAVINKQLYSNDSTTVAVMFTVYTMRAGSVDNVLKPLVLGRGVDAPMPVILLGAIGGMASGGIIGLFLGSVLLALAYQLFMAGSTVKMKGRMLKIKPAKSLARIR